MGLDLKKLEDKLDNALKKETPESLWEFLRKEKEKEYSELLHEQNRMTVHLDKFELPDDLKNSITE